MAGGGKRLLQAFGTGVKRNRVAQVTSKEIQAAP